MHGRSIPPVGGRPGGWLPHCVEARQLDFRMT
jgi:hypothetical protein